MNNDIENHQVLGDYPVVPHIPGHPSLEQIEAARERAAKLNSWQMFDWVDDMDLILSKMTPDAAANYVEVHRDLVAKAMAWQESR